MDKVSTKDIVNRKREEKKCCMDEGVGERAAIVYDKHESCIGEEEWQ